MIIFAIIYIIHLMGFIATLNTPTIFNKSLYGIALLFWGLFGYLGLMIYDTIRGG